MGSLYILIPIAIFFLIVAVGLFIWAVKSGQFDDLGAEGHKILFDDPSEKNAPDINNLSLDVRKRN